ncbi:MAG: NADP oxidoreductase [Synergistetes bacterium HGW-Synergistetes-2]|nr:MAG: NADP oxidoreductase [Synergistetes bacterium HGW-Synergistetes-2]
MDKVRTMDDLRKLRASMQTATELREKGQNIENLIEVKVSLATCGIAAGARETMEAMIREAAVRGLKNVVFTQSGCMGYCHSEPTVTIIRPGEEPVTFGNVKGDKIKEIFDCYILKGELVDGVIPLASKSIHD